MCTCPLTLQHPLIISPTLLGDQQSRGNLSKHCLGPQNPNTSALKRSKSEQQNLAQENADFRKLLSSSRAGVGWCFLAGKCDYQRTWSCHLGTLQRDHQRNLGLDISTIHYSYHCRWTPYPSLVSSDAVVEIFQDQLTGRDSRECFSVANPWLVCLSVCRFFFPIIQHQPTKINTAMIVIGHGDKHQN